MAQKIKGMGLGKEGEMPQSMSELWGAIPEEYRGQLIQSMLETSRSERWAKESPEHKKERIYDQQNAKQTYGKYEEGSKQESPAKSRPS